MRLLWGPPPPGKNLGRAIAVLSREISRQKCRQGSLRLHIRRTKNPETLALLRRDLDRVEAELVRLFARVTEIHRQRSEEAALE